MKKHNYNFPRIPCNWSGHWIRLVARACGLAEVIFSDRCHLIASVLARVCPLMTDSTISGAFQGSVYCTSSTINFLGVECPFSDDVGSSTVVWYNCCLAGCVEDFSQLLKCFSKLLARLMALPRWGHFSFLMGVSQWCYLSAASFEKSLVHLLHICVGFFKHSIKHSNVFSMYHISSSVVANMASSWALVKVLF